ncbi:hypothetical protein JVT61DRAFT_6266 [Boletus reticuloceps]|uniref:Uncharacterized protein n=1 Tax=Boletus reticuloceps TaxID=495285 RepID=A0A8I3A872_9AGAM|nr:hypothetical protein JVT61DRAFT_6266 [Boletus reticuloceps]
MLPLSFTPTLKKHIYQFVMDTSVHRQGTNCRELKCILEKTASEGSLIQHAMKIIEKEAYTWHPDLHSSSQSMHGDGKEDRLA